MIREKRKERRSSPRAKEVFGIKIADMKSDIVAETINISASGIYCQSEHSVPLFRGIGIKIQLPEISGVIECLGVVVRCEKVSGKELYNLAIFFSDMNPKNKESLSNYVEKKLTNKAG